MTINATPIKICCILGTRPEVIKMAPIIAKLKQESWADVTVIATAQHREMLDDMLNIFKIKPQYDLNIMRHDQSLGDVTKNLMDKLEPQLAAGNYAAVLAQGDTTTVFISSLICFYLQIPFGHVEAGLRTYDRYNPFPEEMNRTLTAKLATWHFAPTETEKSILLKEGVKAQDILISGNTVIDALLSLAKFDRPLPVELDPNKKLILITMHRRESFGEPLLQILEAIKQIIARFPDVEVVYPVHPNPNVKLPVQEKLGHITRVHLIPPTSYDQFVMLMKRAYLIMTDSGGVQEEAPALGKPVLVLRAETERPAIIAAGVGKLVGTDNQTIVREVSKLLTDEQAYQAMIKGVSPYGDGKAADRIVNFLKTELLK